MYARLNKDEFWILSYVLTQFYLRCRCVRIYGGLTHVVNMSYITALSIE